MGFRVQGFVSFGGLGFRSGTGPVTVYKVSFGAASSGFRVCCLGFRASGLGVPSFGVGVYVPWWFVVWGLPGKPEELKLGAAYFKLQGSYGAPGPLKDSARMAIVWFLMASI